MNTQPTHATDDATRRQRFEGLESSVPDAIRMIRALTPAQCRDIRLLEHQFIPALGLNDEALQEQPPELSHLFGKGLHIWQYPKQLARYLAWLTDVAPGITTYMEIGSRWGGMFILIAEWLRHNGAALQRVIAVDPIPPTPFLEAYYNVLMQEEQAGQAPPELMYLQALSTSPLVSQVAMRTRPDFVFVDGDHRMAGALFDHMLARKYAQVIVHHDIHSQACPDTTFLWSALKTLEAPVFDTIEFIDQYESVKGNFLGIGALRRRTSPA